MSDVPGLQTIELDYVNAFVLDTEHGRVLVDTGDPTHADRLLAALGDAPLALVVLTHAHGDHVGSLHRVLEATGAKVAAHTEEAALLAQGLGSRPMVAAPFCPPHIREAVATQQRVEPPVQVDHALSDGEEVPGFPGLVAIHTPGHSAGHIALQWGSVLIVGDAAGNQGQPSPPPVAEDYEEVARSIEKLAALGADTAVFGHGTTFTGDVAGAFRSIGAVTV